MLQHAKDVMAFDDLCSLHRWRTFQHEKSVAGVVLCIARANSAAPALLLFLLLSLLMFVMLLAVLFAQEAVSQNASTSS